MQKLINNMVPQSLLLLFAVHALTVRPLVLGEEEASGLFEADGDPLPLRSVSIKADIKGYVMGLRASLKYLNSDQDPVEVLFKLPLESKQAVVGLTAIIDGKKIIARIRGKEEARANYDEVIASGLTATYGEKKTDDVFSVALGNLPGGQEAQIDLEMVEELSIDAEGRVRFSLPTGLKPRYTPPGSVDPLAPLDTGESTTPPQHGTIAGFQEFLMQVSNAQQIADVTSPTHKIKTVPADNDSNILNVTLDEGAELVGDLVIEITHKTPHEPMVLVESGKGAESQSNAFLKSPAIMINFYPDIPETEQVASELIFLVDRSGSMEGEFIESAAETLVLFLKSMPEGSYFNIFGFGSRYESLFPSSVLYNDETLADSITHAQSLRADLGGTEILPALLAIFKQPLIEGITRQIFILTDGAVSNTNECIKEVQKHSHLARCFTFGIGSGASTALVNGIAIAGHGTAEFVKSGERPHPKVIRSLKHALQPAVTDVSVQFSTPSGVAITSSPKKVPPLFDGDKVVIYGIVERQQDPDYTPIGSYEVKLTGELLGGKIFHTLSFEIPLIASAEDGSVLPVHRLMGKSMLQDMITENKPKADIIKLSIEAHVISDETAFIAIHEDTTQVISGPMRTMDIQPTFFCNSAPFAPREAAFRKRAEIVQPHTEFFSAEFLSAHETSGQAQAMMDESGPSELLPDGTSNYGGKPLSSKNAGSFEAIKKQGYALSEHYSTMIDDSEDDDDDDGYMDAGYTNDNDDWEVDPNTQHSQSPSPRTATSSSVVIILQQANGSWTLDETFCTTVGVSMATVESSCPSECTDKRVWSTVIAVVVLKTRFLSQEDEWSLVVKKAESWLKKQVPDKAQLKEFMSKAETMLYSVY